MMLSMMILENGYGFFFVVHLYYDVYADVVEWWYGNDDDVDL